MIDFLKEEKVDSHLIARVEEFRKNHSVPKEEKSRIPDPKFRYYGRDIWEQAISALLCGKNLLLAGPKATGKNVLSENLAAVFGRPSYDISFHVNTDASTLIGADTLKDGNVIFREGPVMRCASCGGFGILDEINMAKNEAISVLHGVLDYRRIIDVPGYDRIHVDDAARFIATMNYGYAGTRELNDALESRFVVISMPFISADGLQKLIRRQFPALVNPYPEQFGALFFDIKKKSDNGEISEKPLDLRGLLDAIDLMNSGLEANLALDMGITNKSFDPFEKKMVRDMIRARIPKKLERNKLFSD
jgi:nitric oxide reductase NorQ protein